MALVCRATWTIKPGNEEIVMAALERLCAPSREEPGIRVYEAYQDPEEPRVVRLFEIYDDEAALEAHSVAEHYVKNVVETVIPALEDRVRHFYQTIDV